MSSLHPPHPDHEVVHRDARGTFHALLGLKGLLSGAVEAIRLTAPKDAGKVPFAYGVQWHPEFIFTTKRDELLDARVLLRAGSGDKRKRKCGNNQSAEHHRQCNAYASKAQDVTGTLRRVLRS